MLAETVLSGLRGVRSHSGRRAEPPPFLRSVLLCGPRDGVGALSVARAERPERQSERRAVPIGRAWAKSMRARCLLLLAFAPAARPTTTSCFGATCVLNPDSPWKHLPYCSPHSLPGGCEGEKGEEQQTMQGTRTRERCREQRWVVPAPHWPGGTSARNTSEHIAQCSPFWRLDCCAGPPAHNADSLNGCRTADGPPEGARSPEGAACLRRSAQSTLPTHRHDLQRLPETNTVDAISSGEKDDHKK